MKWTVVVVVFTVIPGFDKQSGRKSNEIEAEWTWRYKTWSPQTKAVLGPTLNLARKKMNFMISENGVGATTKGCRTKRLG